MKKFVAILAAMMFAILAVMPVTGACAESGSKVYVYSGNGQTVNVRAEASTKGEIIARVSYGTQVTKLGTVGSWTRVSVTVNRTKVTGYMMSKFLRSTDPNHTEQAFRKVSRFTGKVVPSGSNGYVNVRASASTSARSLAKLRKGANVTVTAESAYWYKVTMKDGTTGYIVKSYVRK